MNEKASLFERFISSDIFSLFTFGGKMAWVSEVFIVVFLTLLAGALANKSICKLEVKLQKTITLWDDALVISLRKPLRALIWLLGLTFALEIVTTETDIAIQSAIPSIREIGIILTIAWFALRFIRKAEASIIAGHKRDGKEIDISTVDAIGKLLRITTIITTALVTLQTLGISVSGVLAFGGISGVAVGFAAKDLLSNFFGALMIYFDKPFKIGDWIRSPDRSIEGTVEAIGWRQTRIRTFDKRPLYVPNSVFSTIAVENPSRMTHRRIYETIGVRYADVKAVKNIVDDVKKMLIDHPEIDESQTMIVHLNEFNSSSVDFFVYTFTHTTDWIKFHSVKEDVLLKISDIIESHKAEIAFPTSTIHVPDGIALADNEKAA